jgi:hypothetical protein
MALKAFKGLEKVLINGLNKALKGLHKARKALTGLI